MASTLQPWLERDDLLDTVTRAEMISNDGRYEYVYNLSLLDINSYLANGLLVKNCGCFECIVMLIPEANGVMVVSREDTSMTPAGMTFSTLAGMAGGGLQTPGVMGVGKYYLISPKFISADGGLKRVVWMSSILKETMGEELRAAEQDYPPSWIEEAIRLAVERNARNWRYIRRVLERWQAEGKDRGLTKRPTQADRYRYIQGEYSDTVDY